jgi:hypothetical protein
MIKYAAFNQCEHLTRNAATIMKQGQKLKSMKRASWQGKSIRTTITMNRKLYRDLRALMVLHGYGDNFSSFIADCAREQRRKLARQGGPMAIKSSKV